MEDIGLMAFGYPPVESLPDFSLLSEHLGGFGWC